MRPGSQQGWGWLSLHGFLHRGSRSTVSSTSLYWAAVESSVLKWADKNFQTLIMRSLPGAEAVPDEALASLLGEEIKDGHALLTLALGLQAKPEIRRLLTQLGYSLRSVRRTQSDRGVYLISHWRMEWEGRIHVVDVAYSLKNRSVATRCWSLRQL